MKTKNNKTNKLNLELKKLYNSKKSVREYLRKHLMNIH